ncbi:hypothetical protein [Spiroplasma endosymbiont of Dilophus febrilis]|uniref:hypothetical protein n=1 Tax=Spiroplasma endosymbiont of Dilophus febrilis TaxID=3066292 RepID=UPI00313BF52D
MSKTIFIVIGIFILLSIFGTFFVNWLWIKLRKLKSTNNENYLKLKKCWFALVVLQISFIVTLAIVTILKTQ